MRLVSMAWRGNIPNAVLRLLPVFSAAVVISCTSGAGEADSGNSDAQMATLPQTLCNLLPRDEAERIMQKPLTEQRNDDYGCHYQDAAGTTGTGLSIDLYVTTVSDQCRLTRGSEPLSGVGDEACIAVRSPEGMYTTVVFGSGGRTFVAIAPGQDKTSELATAVARVVISKLGA